MRPLNAGDLRHPIVFQSRTDTKNSFGELVPTWPTFASVWAKIEPLTGKDLQLLLTMGVTATHRVTCRYLPGIVADGTMKISYTPGGSTTPRIFTITSALNIEERDYLLVIMATEDLRQ